MPKRARSRAAVLLASTVAAIGLAACGSDDDDGGSTGSSTTAGASTTASSGQEPSGEPIVTYTFANVNTEGAQFKNIAETARVYGEWVNANGGIKGRPVDVRFCDGRGTPTDAEACAREAVENEAVAVVGSAGLSGDTVVPILDKGGIASFGNCCSVSAADFTNDSVFNMGNQLLYGPGLIKAAVDDGCQSINAVIIEGAEAFAPLLENAAEELGTKLGKVVTLPGVARDYSPQVAEATDGADCLAMVVSEGNFIAWMPAFAQSGSEARMYGPQGNLNDKVAEGFEELTDGAVISGMYPDLSLPQWDDFRGALETYDADMEQDYNSQGALGAWAAYEGFRQVVEGMDGEIDHDTFMKAAETAKIDLPGMVPPIDFTKGWSNDGGPEGFDRVFNRCVIFSELRDGEVVPVGEEFEDVSEVAGGTKPMQCN